MFTIMLSSLWDFCFVWINISGIKDDYYQFLMYPSSVRFGQVHAFSRICLNRCRLKMMTIAQGVHLWYGFVEGNSYRINRWRFKAHWKQMVNLPGRFSMMTQFFYSLIASLCYIFSLVNINPRWSLRATQTFLFFVWLEVICGDHIKIIFPLYVSVLKRGI